jgi:hypothetical protein
VNKSVNKFAENVDVPTQMSGRHSRSRLAIAAG